MKAKKMGGALLTLTLLFGIGVASSLTANAQWSQWPNNTRNRDYEREQIRRQRQLQREQRRQQRRTNRDYGRENVYSRNDNDGRYDGYNDGLPNYGGSFELRQTALNAGYNEGIKEGRKDRQNNERFEYQDEEDYRNANTDYSSKLGNRELYRQYFRQGFQNGYRDGFGNNGYNY